MSTKLMSQSVAAATPAVFRGLTRPLARLTTCFATPAGRIAAVDAAAPYLFTDGRATRVTRVTTRDGFVEYACFCGHTFLRSESGLSVVKHPAVCVLAGHWITFVTDRAGYSEYVCTRCGHPFCFVSFR